MPGVFISLEGPDGSGKTTVSKLVQQQLEEEGYRVLLTREPGGIDIAEQIRNIILDINNTAMDIKTETLLYAAARRQHLIEKVLPAVEAGYIVICDRFIDSSLVYQGVARGIGIETVYQINQFAIEEVMPMKTIFFDIPYQLGLKRIRKGDRVADRLDLETSDFHQKVYNGYMTVCEMYKNRIVKINANATIDDVKQQVLKEIRECI